MLKRVAVNMSLDAIARQIMFERNRPLCARGSRPWSLILYLNIYILPNRVVRVTAITILDEYDVVRLEYEMTPPKDPFPDDDSDTAWATWYSQNAWLTTARDDVGTEYDDWGGAQGLSPDQATTQGEFDFHPAPPPHAQWLEFTFRGGSTVKGEDHTHHTLRLTLPLNTASPDQSYMLPHD